MFQDQILLRQWHVVAKSQDVADNAIKPVRLMGEDIVLWRTKNEVHAWQDLCLHRGSMLSMGFVDDGCLVCPYHYWTYNNQGKCIKIPAHPEQIPPDKAQVVTYHVREQYGLIWVAFKEPAKEIPEFTEWDNPEFQKILCGPYVFEAYPERAMENALDVAHLATLHEGYLGDRYHAEIPDYDVVTNEEGITASNIRIWQPNPDGTGIAKDVVYNYRVYRPLIGYMEKVHEKKFSLFFSVTPVDDRLSHMWMWMNLNYAFDQSQEELRAFQDVVAGQDTPIVSTQRPEKLPLDLQEELHLRSDKTAIAYRKWLRGMGVTYGVA